VQHVVQFLKKDVAAVDLDAPLLFVSTAAPDVGMLCCCCCRLLFPFIDVGAAPVKLVLSVVVG